MDRLEAARLDAWLTRQPPEPDVEVVPRCQECGRFVKADVLWRLVGEDVDVCDGPSDDFYPMCGEGSSCPGAGHWYLVNVYTVLYRRCSAGHLTKEFVL